MDSERDISVEELYWEECSGETAAEMGGGRNGQREKLSSDAVTAVTSALKLEWPLRELDFHGGQPGTLQTCQCLWASQRRGISLDETAFFGRGQFW